MFILWLLWENAVKLCILSSTQKSYPQLSTRTLPKNCLEIHVARMGPIYIRFDLGLVQSANVDFAWNA